MDELAGADRTLVQLVAPLMAAIEKDYKGSVKVVKIEHDASKSLIERYKVYGLPALILFKDGKAMKGPLAAFEEELSQPSTW